MTIMTMASLSVKQKWRIDGFFQGLLRLWTAFWRCAHQLDHRTTVTVDALVIGIYM